MTHLVVKLPGPPTLLREGKWDMFEVCPRESLRDLRVSR